jgi:threonine synthase
MRRKHMVEKVGLSFAQIKESGIGGDSQYYEFTDIQYPYKDTQEFPLKGKTGMARFLPLLPIHDFHTEIPGLGDTPLNRADNFGKTVGLKNLWIKREDQNPTGCFKDRESAVTISAAIENGHQVVYIVSSGNAALSTAHYAKAAGIRCTCYVPEKTSEEKKQLIRKNGAELREIPGFYEDVYRTVVDMHPLGWNVTSGQNPYRIEGGKTMAYEIFEQLGKVPDYIVIPSGNGGCLAATWKGFTELKKMGKIDKLPVMVCVQIKGAAPIKTALERKAPFVRLGDIDDSVAEGIVAQESYNSPQAVLALQESKGWVIEVTDAEVVMALRTIMDTEQFVPEPTAAATFAALSHLDVDPNALVVAVNTGDGKKMMNEVHHVLSLLPTKK